MKKPSSQSPSQRSTLTDDHAKPEFEDPEESAVICDKPKKSWLRKLNPFLAREVPPVPSEDAGLVPDLQANFWNKLTWGWMGPLMLVSFLSRV